MTTTPNLRALLAPNPSPMTLDGTRTYVVGRVRPVVIDPGPADEGHVDGILELLDGVRPASILLTHAHGDHAAASEALSRRTGGAPVLMAHAGTARDVGSIPVDRWLDDGDEVASDAGPLRAVATPGHTPEHLAYYWYGPAAPPGGAVFVGDLMMGEGDTTLVAPPEGDLAAYLRSLTRVRDIDPGLLFPTHGPPITDPANAIERFLAHRRERIRQVSQARLAHPTSSAAELMPLIYGATLDRSLVAAAVGSIRAILRYLDEVGVDD